MIEDEIPNTIIGPFGEFKNFINFTEKYLKKAQNLTIFGQNFHQNSDFLGTRIVRVFGQKYSRFE